MYAQYGVCRLVKIEWKTPSPTLALPTPVEAPNYINSCLSPVSQGRTNSEKARLTALWLPNRLPRPVLFHSYLCSRDTRVATRECQAVSGEQVGTV